MPATRVNGNLVKKWYVDSRKVRKAYVNSALCFEDEYVLLFAGSNHNIDTDSVWLMLPDWVRNDPNQPVRIIVNAGVDLVSLNTGVRGVFNFYGGWAGRKVTIENRGRILGRGGNGGSCAGATSYPGAAGGRAIYNESVNLFLYNYGVIGGGGGGGSGTGAKNSGSSSQCSWGGGGGAPFGAGGSGYGGTYNGSGSAAGIDYAGNGVKDKSGNAGNGGMWGVRGEDSSRGSNTGSYWPNVGGAAGEAIRGRCNIVVQGDIRGAIVL